MAEIIRTPLISEVTRELSLPRDGSDRRYPDPNSQPVSTLQQRSSKLNEAIVETEADRKESPTFKAHPPEDHAGEENPKRSQKGEQSAEERMVTPPAPDPIAMETALREVHKEELGRLREEAATEGYREGYEKGYEEIKRSYEQLIRNLHALLETLATERQTLVSQSEDDIVEVVFAAVVKILGDVMCTTEGIVAAVRQAMRQVTQASPLVVRVCPDDYEFLKESEKELLEGFEQSATIVPDVRVAMGGGLLETASGTLDGRLDVQLQKLREVLLHVRSQRRIDETETNP